MVCVGVKGVENKLENSFTEFDEVYERNAISVDSWINFLGVKSIFKENIEL